MRTPAAILLTTSCAAIFALPLCGGLLGVDAPWRTVENRLPAPRPAWPADQESLVAFPERFDRYLEDGFAFRGAFVRANSLLRYVLFDESFSDLVLLGEDGWMFYYQGDLPLHYTGRKPMLPVELELRAALLERTRAPLAAREIPFAFLIAPNKASIYPEKLPAHVRARHGIDRIDQLVRYLDDETSIRVVDAASALRAAKDQGLLYYPRGTHWTSLGAWFAYDALLRALGEEVEGLEPLPRSAFEEAPIARPDAGLAHAAALEGLHEERFTELRAPWRNELRTEPLALAELGWTGPVREPLTFRIVHPGRTGRILVFRDSFWEQMQEMVAGHFGECVLVGARPDPELLALLVEHERPDVVVEQVVERNQ